MTSGWSMIFRIFHLILAVWAVFMSFGLGHLVWRAAPAKIHLLQIYIGYIKIHILNFKYIYSNLHIYILNLKNISSKH